MSPLLLAVDIVPSIVRLVLLLRQVSLGWLLDLLDVITAQFLYQPNFLNVEALIHIPV